MLLSKANIMVEGIAAGSEGDPELQCVHLAGDGTTIAANGRMIMAVEPVAEGSFFPIGEEEQAEPPPEGVSLPLHIISQLRKILPRDKKAVMQQAALTVCTDEKVELTTISKTEERKVAGRPLNMGFPKWREVFAESRARATKTRVCVRRKDLMELLTALDKSCEDPSGKNVVFMEVGGPEDPLLLRGLNLATGQHVIGVVNPMNTQGKWISEDPWEKELYATEVELEDGEDLPAVAVRGRKRIGERRVHKRKVK